jgi:hypothetical protein
MVFRVSGYSALRRHGQWHNELRQRLAGMRRRDHDEAVICLQYGFRVRQ